MDAMNIAIVGAGFLGVASAWHLTQIPGARITLFDTKGIGAGASGIAAGLLHPFAGAKATRNWMADESFPETLALLKIASQTIATPVFKQSGIFRPATTLQQHEDFYKRASEYADCSWCETTPSPLFTKPGLFIPAGIQVDCPLYLEGLWKACSKRGAKLIIETINSPSDLSDFDISVFTIGTGFLDLKEVMTPPLSAVKGQLLELCYDDILECGVSSHAYLAQNKHKIITAGATYEHSWQVEGPDIERCEAEIRAKVAAFCPKLADLALHECKAGYRAVTKDKKPFFVEVSPNCYCLGGLGSKGLLYHAWLAKRLFKTLQK
jgi:glycine/D-amino acid oxidase-like deaminating enzyme